mmetsp:Transcript_56003/g.119242  ORF Transcript_56003/g.119242 Transcript_56003/m.119242 type:complete len:278 (+) Transcript_56003:298-1131(+)
MWALWFFCLHWCSRRRSLSLADVGLILVGLEFPHGIVPVGFAFEFLEILLIGPKSGEGLSSDSLKLSHLIGLVRLLFEPTTPLQFLFGILGQFFLFCFLLRSNPFFPANFRSHAVSVDRLGAFASLFIWSCQQCRLPFFAHLGCLLLQIAASHETGSETTGHQFRVIVVRSCSVLLRALLLAGERHVRVGVRIMTSLRDRLFHILLPALLLAWKRHVRVVVRVMASLGRLLFDIFLPTLFLARKRHVRIIIGVMASLDGLLFDFWFPAFSLAGRRQI